MRGTQKYQDCFVLAITDITMALLMEFSKEVAPTYKHYYKNSILKLPLRSTTLSFIEIQHRPSFLPILPHQIRTLPHSPCPIQRPPQILNLAFQSLRTITPQRPPQEIPLFLNDPSRDPSLRDDLKDSLSALLHIARLVPR